MMFRKNKMLLNIVIDFVMLTAMALVSISGFILEIVIPSRHAVKFQGATPWSSQLLGLGRHDWRSEERRVGKECRSRWSPYH